MRYKRDRKNGKRFLAAGLGVLVVAFVSLNIFLPEKVFSNFAFAAFPFLKGSDVVRENAEAVTTSKRELVRVNTELREKIAELEFESLKHRVALRENKELKAALDRESDGHSLVLAAVLAKPPVSPYDSFIVDVGHGHGLEVGDHVYAFGHIAVGEVFEIAEKVTKVRLFSSPGSTMNVFIGENNTPAKAVGKGGGNFEARLPRGMEIEVGDEVIVPGLESIVLGEVEHIERQQNDSFQMLHIKSPVNLWQLRFTQVGLGTAYLNDQQVHFEEDLFPEPGTEEEAVEESAAVEENDEQEGEEREDLEGL